MTLKHKILLAFSRPIVIRGLFYGVVVGLILNGINHGPNLWCGEYSSRCVLQMALTFMVPYLVSTFSSVQAILHSQQPGPSDGPSANSTNPAY